jgi:hypothetical protein
MGGLRTSQARLATCLLAVASVVPALAQNPPSTNSTQQHQPAASQVHRQPNRHAGDWLKKYKDVPPDQQEKALDNDAAFRRLPPDRQAKLRQQLQNFRSLPPQKQQKVLNRMQTWEGLTPAQKKQAKAVTAKIRQMPPERRAAMMGAIRDLRQMPPEQREQAIASDKYRSSFSDQERQLLRNVSQLPLAPATASNQPEQGLETR